MFQSRAVFAASGYGWFRQISDTDLRPDRSARPRRQWSLKEPYIGDGTQSARLWLNAVNGNDIPWKPAFI